MAKTKISWSGHTWNPLVGCTRHSAGCDNCYAAVMTRRLAAMGQNRYQGLIGKGHFNGVVREVPEVLSLPMKRKKPTMYFVNSMSDLFHKAVSEDFIDQVFAVMASCPQHTFQVLTKRADRMAKYMLNPWRLDNIYDVWYSVNDGAREVQAWPLPNVWLGTSVENQEQADKRIPELLKVPAAVKFLSCEPLLGPVDLWGANYRNPSGGYTGAVTSWRGVDWVIVGCESGHGARPMSLDWVRSIRDECVAANVPFFFKQQLVNGRKVELPELDGQVWAQFPQQVVA